MTPEEKKLIELLKEYEQWEADLISEDKMWWPFTKNDVLTGEVYDKMLVLQEKRNSLLSSFNSRTRIECSLDAQQCQQECKHKNNRAECPFTKL